MRRRRKLALSRQEPTAFGDDLVLVFLDQRAQAARLSGFRRSQLGRASHHVHFLRCHGGASPYASTSKAVTGLTVSLSIASNTTAMNRPVEVVPKMIGDPELRLVPLPSGSAQASSASFFVKSWSAMCCTLPSGSSSKSQMIMV
jgi:hypothetical protein